MRFLLITLGSHGDIHPFFALAKELQGLGHEAVVATGAMFASQAARACVPFEPLGEAVDLKELMQVPGVMHPYKGAKAVLKDVMLPMVPELYRRTQEMIQKYEPDMAVIHPVCMGASWACEKPLHGRQPVPIATCVLAPICWMESQDRTVFTPWRGPDLNVRASRLDAWICRWVVDGMLDRPLNAIRKNLGLSKRKHLLTSEMVRPGLNLGLWSQHFRPALPNDPAGSAICGFPWFDDHHDHTHDWSEVQQFLDNGEEPIVFTLGTAAVHLGSEFMRMAATACQSLNRRGIIMIGRQEYQEALGQLPKNVLACTYAPFSKLFPRAKCIVHHGGIGTTAQGLRSGRPTLITPLAHDQFDNAARAYRHDLSDILFFSKLSPKRLIGHLDKLIHNEAGHISAQAFAQKLVGENGARIAASRLVDSI